MKQVVIVGGGTAGWMTALWANKHLPNTKVTLLESESVGIIRAGEGTVSGVPQFFESLGISPFELIAETQGTLKLGIEFINWNGTNESYFHDFEVEPRWCDVPDHVRMYYTYAKQKDFPSKLLMQSGKVPFIIDDNGELKTVPWFNDAYTFHFDGVQVGQFMRKKAEERGVKRVEGKAVEFVQSDKGIDQVKLEDGTVLDCDFIFDCSGFARLVIGNVLKSEYIKYDKYLPVNSAIPYFPEQKKDNIDPYTRAIAMNYGWGWKVPLQHRFGAGYVFNDDMISYDDAKRELDQLAGYEVNSPKTFKFSAGTFKTPWIKNCVAIGLSQGFLEPLEATALWISTNMLTRLIDFVPFIFDPTDKMVARYNEEVMRGSETCLAFVYYHYMTQREDTEFWRYMKYESEVPKKLNNILDDSKDILMDHSTVSEMFPKSLVWFDLYSFLAIGMQKGIVDKGIYLEYINRIDPEKVLDRQHDKYMKDLRSAVESFPTHKEVLNHINMMYGKEII